MKKFLTLLGSLGLVATASLAVVSCQVQIEGDSLKKLGEEFNAKENTLAMANPNLSVKGLHDQVIQLLTRTLVDNYGMDKEGYFLISEISTITIGDLELVKDSTLLEQPKTDDGKNDDEKIKTAIIGEKPVVITISEVTFNFKLNTTFNN